MNKKIPVGILGATGTVGQKFVELLAKHPWFEIIALAASEKSYGKKYGDVVNWMMPSPLCPRIAQLLIQPCIPKFPCSLIFSSLDSSVAGEIEEQFAQAGYFVISNSRNHRMNPIVPLLIPEVNSDHLELLHMQPFGKGKIITNPNCSVIGLTMAFKPLLDQWEIENAHIVTMQAISGAGYPGISSMDILDNVIPFIAGEEEKIETEPLKILGKQVNRQIIPYSMQLSAQCNRVAVMDGHMASISIKFRSPTSKEDLINTWRQFKGKPQQLNLPTAPQHPLIYFDQEKYPQPKLHRYLEKGMAVSIGHLRPCTVFDWKFTILSHNTVRGAAGCAILNAELMIKEGFFPLNS